MNKIEFRTAVNQLISNHMSHELSCNEEIPKLPENIELPTSCTSDKKPCEVLLGCLEHYLQYGEFKKDFRVNEGWLLFFIYYA